MGVCSWSGAGRKWRLRDKNSLCSAAPFHDVSWPSSELIKWKNKSKTKPKKTIFIMYRKWEKHNVLSCTRVWVCSREDMDFSMDFRIVICIKYLESSLFYKWNSEDSDNVNGWLLYVYILFQEPKLKIYSSIIHLMITYRCESWNIT